MRRAVLALALALAAGPAQAQDVAALARQYAEMPEVQVMFDEMMSPDSLARQFASGLPPGMSLTDDQLARVGAVMAEMMAGLRPDLTALMIEAMARSFTAEEISALIAFYGSEHGASVMAKMQPFFQDVMGQLMPLLQARQQAYLPELIAILSGE